MEICVFGLGKAGNNIVDAMLDTKYGSGSSSLVGTLAIDACKTSLGYLEYVCEDNQVLLGSAKLSGHSTGNKVEVGKEIVENGEDAIIDGIPSALDDELSVLPERCFVSCAESRSIGSNAS